MPTQLVQGAESSENKPIVTRKVSIWLRYKQEGEWVMKQAQWSANRRNLVPGMAKGARIAAEEYLYYLRYQRESKRIMEPAGRDSVTAVALATTREIELFAAERGQQVQGTQVVATNSRGKFADAAQAYLRQIAGGTKRSTYNASGWLWKTSKRLARSVSTSTKRRLTRFALFSLGCGSDSTKTQCIPGLPN